MRKKAAKRQVALRKRTQKPEGGALVSCPARVTAALGVPFALADIRVDLSFFFFIFSGGAWDSEAGIERSHRICMLRVVR